MNIYYSKIGVVSTVLATVACLLFNSTATAQGQLGASQTDKDAPQLSTNAPPQGFATRLDYIKSFTSYAEIDKAYRSGSITKEEAMLAMSMDKIGPDDKSPMNTYGKVVDQSGQPVAGVKVRGFLEFEEQDNDEEHDTLTDGQGRFQFLGLHGSGFGIVPEKGGYEYNRNIGFAVLRPKNYLPDPNNPLVFTMWKLRGAEPMAHDKLHAYIPCDGSITHFDLLTGKKSSDGDFSVRLTRNPVNIVRGQSFAWTVTLEVTNGGLQAITNLYPNEAPADGYQSKMTFEFQPNAKDWSSHFTPAFYFKAKNGQVYGRMAINIMSDFQPPPTLFDADIFANPAGSRNLEFDPKKQTH